MLTLIKRIFKSGWTSFSRDGGLATATIFVIVMTVSLVTSLFLFKEVSQFVITNLEEKVDISVYFKEEALEDDIFKVREEITEISEVKEVKYISKEQALADFIQRHEDDPVLMESLAEVGVNPFLAALNIKAFEASQYQAVANFLEETLSPSYQALIEKVDYYQRKPVIERIFTLTSTANKAGIGLSLVVALIAVLVVFNTIRLAIYNCREEISVQRLVGASNWFIRGPFLVQGALAGFLAALVCLLLFTLLSFAFNSTAQSLFPELNLFSFFVANFWIIFFVQLLTGIGLGVISSLIAIRKYLRV